jgi:predicted aminopeptidase
MKVQGRDLIAIGVAGGLAALLTSCSQLGYYVQAAQGEFSLLADARPIDDWLANPATSATLRDRLNKVKTIRSFAATELGLPDNGTFKTYTELKRPYALWNVVATPELSMRPAQWCFPVAGCVNYRGYYSRDDAQFFATSLRTEGFDVQVAGVPAYSTLGWFNDPVLSSFIQYPDPELARLVFHELAHQVAYAQDDSQFNESFATAVEDIGLERWLVAFGNDALRKAHFDRELRKQDFLTLLLKSRKALEENYAGTTSKIEKKQRKAAIFDNLVADYQALKISWGGYAGYDRWFGEPLSNAHLAAISTYHDFVPEFRALMLREKTLPRFYAAVKALASLDKATRHRQLHALALQPTPEIAQAGIYGNP